MHFHWSYENINELNIDVCFFNDLTVIKNETLI